jgi:hypothetical protein
MAGSAVVLSALTAKADRIETHHSASAMVKQLYLFAATPDAVQKTSSTSYVVAVC